MHKKEATEKFEKFIYDCLKSRLKIIQVITGKGKNSENHQPIIRPTIDQLIRQNKKNGNIVQFKWWNGNNIKKSGSVLIQLR